MGFGLIFLIVLAMGSIAWYQSNKMHEQTMYLYNHPLQVRSNIGEIKSTVMQIHRDMKNLFLVVDDQELEATLFDIEAADARLMMLIDDLKGKYLGPPEDVVHLQKGFISWDIKRDETVRLLREGKTALAAARTKDSGIAGAEVLGMMKHINEIDVFARNKSEEFYTTSEALNKRMNFQLALIILLMLGLTFYIYHVLVNSIRNPVNDLISVTSRFSAGERSARSTNMRNDEPGSLAKAFNHLADSVEHHLWLGEQLNEMAEVMSAENEAEAFFRQTAARLAVLCKAELVSVYLVDEEKKNLVLFVSVGAGTQLRKTFNINAYEGEFGFSLLSHQMHHHKNLKALPDLQFPTSSATLMPREVVTLPLLMPEGLIGIVSLGSLQPFGQKELALMSNIHEMLSARAASVLTMARIREFSDKLEDINALLEEQKLRLDKALSYNRGLLEASLDPLVTIGPDGSITDVNKATEDILGVERDLLIGTDFSTCFSDPARARAGYQLAFEKGFVRDYELDIRRGDGHLTPVTYNASVFYDDNKQVAGVFAAARDLTERKALEAEKQRLYEELAQRSAYLESANEELEMQKNELAGLSAALTEQNTELELQKKQLDEANRLKSLFLSNMSHELRTPLNSVIALSGVLSRKLKGLINDESYGYLEVIAKNGKNLLNLINEILDLSRIEAGKAEVTLSRFNLQEEVEELLRMLQPAADENKVKITNLITADFPSIVSDRGKVRHILQNLLANAVKFTGDGTVEVAATKDEKFYTITVSDTGIGIEADKLQLIFDEFRQADEKTSRRYGGSGLGLSIARRYSELCGGHITVESTAGVGSVFRLFLPAINELLPEIALDQGFTNTTPVNAHNISAGEKTILVVEDSEPQVVQLREMLESAGYQVVVATDGLKALERIREQTPDAIILDLMMPGMDGFSVLATIRQTMEVIIPVLILTAKHISKEELSFLRGNNISQLVQKGELNREELLARIGAIFIEPPASTPATARPAVLLVEDNADNRLTMQAMLQEQFSLFVAVDGRSGLKLAAEAKPDIILLDINLPDIDGFAVLQEIKANAQLLGLPVVAVTAKAMKEDQQRLQAAGFDAILTKPVEHSSLEQTINDLLYGKRTV